MPILTRTTKSYLAALLLLICAAFSVTGSVAPKAALRSYATLLPEVTVVGHRPTTPPLPVMVSATVYYPTGDPTFDGTPVFNKALKHLNWCAVSPDMLRKGGWRMGDTLLVVGGNLPANLKGLYVLHDLTCGRHNRKCKRHYGIQNRIDLLVPKGSHSDRWDSIQVRRFTINELTL